MDIESEMYWIIINTKSVLIHLLEYLSLSYNCLFVDNVNHITYMFKVMLLCVKCGTLIVYCSTRPCNPV